MGPGLTGDFLSYHTQFGPYPDFNRCAGVHQPNHYDQRKAGAGFRGKQCIGQACESRWKMADFVIRSDAGLAPSAGLG